jgi:hypothetical protein
MATPIARIRPGWFGWLTAQSAAGGGEQRSNRDENPTDDGHAQLYCHECIEPDCEFAPRPF